MTSPTEIPAMRAGDPRPSVLVVTMGTDYVAPARMPRELRAAGFRVALLAPRSAVATHTRHLDHLGFLPERGNAFVWLQTLAAAVEATRPDFVLPGDEITLRLLMRVALEPPLELRPEIAQSLRALVTRSLGDPAHYLDSVDKSRTLRLAREIGLPVPPGDAVADVDEALAVAGSIGYPVVVRPAYGSASEGVAVCRDAGTLRRAMSGLRVAQVPLDPPARPVLVQRFIDGLQYNRAALGFGGREIAGFTRIAVRRYPDALGPGSVARYERVPEVAEASRCLIAALGLTGFASTLFILDPATRTPYLIEINRRMTPATHTGRLVGIDLASAFADCVAGREGARPPDLPDGFAAVLALFPQEWLRDPDSVDLNRLPTDAPFDDPDLLRAFLDLARR